MDGEFCGIVKSREKYEDVLKSLKESGKYFLKKEYILCVEEYHQAIMLRFRYDILGFVEFFLIQSRRGNSFRKVEWIFKKMFEPLQEILDSMFLGKSLYIYIDSFKSESKKRRELNDFETRKRSENEKMSSFEKINFFKKYNEEKKNLNEEIDLILKNREYAYSILSNYYSETTIQEAIEEYNKSLEFEGNSIANSLLKGSEYKDFETENPLLKKIFEKKMGFVVKSGNFFGKSFALAVISIWGLICYDDMVVKSFVSKKDRELNIKRDLQLVGETMLDGILLDNGIDSGIFSHIFVLNQKNVYKKVLSDPESTHYWSKWTWFTDYAMGSKDTKGGRSQHQIMIFDEASEAPSGAINGAITNIRRELDAMNLIFLTGNPNREVGKPVNEFFKILDLKSVYEKFYNIVELTEKDIDTELVKGSFIVRYLSKTEGKNSVEYKERVSGLIEEDSVIFSRDFIDKTMDRIGEVEWRGLCLAFGEGDVSEFRSWSAGKFIYVGIDPAGVNNSGDRFGIAVRSRNEVAFVCGLYDQKQVINMIRNIWTIKNAKKNVVFCIERNGAGAWFPQYVSTFCGIPKQYIKDFVGHGNSFTSISHIEKDACKDLAAICVLRLCEAMKNGLRIRYNEFLRSEIINMKWKNHVDGKFDIDKMTYKVMFKQSPDLFDALTYSFAVGNYDSVNKKLIVKKNNNYLKRGVC